MYKFLSINFVVHLKYIFEENARGKKEKRPGEKTDTRWRKKEKKRKGEGIRESKGKTQGEKGRYKGWPGSEGRGQGQTRNHVNDDILICLTFERHFNQLTDFHYIDSKGEKITHVNGNVSVLLVNVYEISKRVNEVHSQFHSSCIWNAL